MTYVQYPSGSGIRYPLSGELIGQAADFLRLKTGLERLKEGPSYKTAQRYFRGERVEPENVRLILDELVAVLLPAELIPPDLLPAGIDACTWLREFIEDLAGSWDRLVAEMDGQGFPILHREDVPVPFLRLIVLDLGIRWAAFQVLRLADIMEGVGVSENTLDSWRQGKSLPTEQNLHLLAKFLAGATESRLEGLKARLRLIIGISAGRHRLEGLCGEERVEDFVAAFETTASRMSDVLLTASFPRSERRTRLLELIHRGAGTCG